MKVLAKLKNFRELNKAWNFFSFRYYIAFLFLFDNYCLIMD